MHALTNALVHDRTYECSYAWCYGWSCSCTHQSFLSGMPELKLGLNDKLLFESSGRSSGSKKAVELEDIKFHQ